MTQRGLIAALLALTACAATRDIYVGSDFSSDAASSVPDAGDDGRAPLAPNAPAADGGGSGDSGLPVPPLVCASGTADCDSDRATGCEVDLTRTAAHCGECGRACQFPDCACRNGQLVVECPVGRADCDANPVNGCEIDLRTTMQHCGACGRLCHTNGHDAVAAVCVAGQCEITCQIEAFPEGDCDRNPDNGCETQLWANDQHCGMCGRRCSCSNGTCL